MASGGASPSSSRETKSINFTKIKSKCRSLAAKLCPSKRKSPQHYHQNAASSSATTERNDHHGEDLSSSPSDEPGLVDSALESVDSALASYNGHMNDQIHRAREELKKVGSSERDFEQLRKDIEKLKSQIPTPLNIFYSGDHHGGAPLSPSLSSSSELKRIHDDLLLAESDCVDAKKHMDDMSLKINQAHMKFREMQKSRPYPDRGYDELQKDIKKLKFQIPWVKIRSADSNRHPHQWPDINGPDGKNTHFFYKDPGDTHSGNSDGLLEDFSALPLQIMRICLLCFFKFPPEEIIKRTAMIYMWIGLGYTNFLNGRDTNENYANKIFDYLVGAGFIEPIYQTCSLVPDSCRMNFRVRAALYNEAKYLGFTSNDNLQLELGLVWGQSCLVNVGQANLDWEPGLLCSEARNEEREPSSEHPNDVSRHHCLPGFRVRIISEKKILGQNAHHIRNLYLGRWQRLTKHTHHIELTDNRILDGLQNMKNLTFLSLRGISMITELPTSMVKLKCLEILDLRACHNLEAIPENIGMLQSLTHLDMSECYFLEHMPESLSKLSNLEVLKGFVVGEENKESCTLSNLSSLNKLRKLNIYVSVKKFAGRSDFDPLQDFKVLQKLTISWGGSSFEGEERLLALCTKGCLELPQTLQKLDIRCFPAECLADWFKPAKIAGLKKLYIQGGRLCRIGQIQECQVEILRLKYLHDLKIDWSELRKLFPKLIYLMYKAEDTELAKLPSNKKGMQMNLEAEYPEFTIFSRNEGTVWMSKEGLRSDKQLQKLQKYLKQVAKVPQANGMIS